MNIKIVGESKQEEILYTPYHISYNLTGYTKIVVMRNYVIKSCNQKDLNYFTHLNPKEIAYFFFGPEISWLNLFKDREIDYAGFHDGHLLVLDKAVMSGHLDVTLSVHVSFILYVEDNPRVEWVSYLFVVLIIIVLIGIALYHTGL